MAAVSYPLVGWWAIVVTAVAAVGKELYDKYSGKGTPELMDIVYTVSGGLVVVVMLTAAAELLATVNQC